MVDTKRILVADPDRTERERLARVVRAAAELAGVAVQVDQARDGTTAMAMWSEHRPDLVVCEVLLEGMSGLSLMRRMQSEHGSLPPVLLVTAMGRESDRYWGLRNGAHGYLRKPYDDEQLRRRVQAIFVDGPERTRERMET